MPDDSVRLPLLLRARLYFTDLSFYTRSTLGPSEATKRRWWLVACYVAFALGIFCRQIVDLSRLPNLELDQTRLQLSKFVASLIVGLAIFPLVVRQVRRVADHIFDDGKSSPPETTEVTVGGESRQGGWNLIHVFTSFTTGFLIHLAYDKAIQIIRT